MIKKLNLTILDIILYALVLILLCLLILIKINRSASYCIYSLFSKYKIIKQEASIQVYSEINHPDCHITKESLSNRQTCLNNNGVWLYNSKTCTCRPTFII